MRPEAEYIAQRAIKAPGTMVYAYQRGDDVPAGAVENWELSVGDDGDVLPVNTGIIPRPADDASRGEWEGYVIGQGTNTEDARAMSLDELRDAYAEGDAEQPATVLPDPTNPQRPADSEKKAAWISYVEAKGADSAWANASDTTKADLMNWEPSNKADIVPGDTVAVAASDLANG